MSKRKIYKPGTMLIVNDNADVDSNSTYLNLIDEFNSLKKGDIILITSYKNNSPDNPQYNEYIFLYKGNENSLFWKDIHSSNFYDVVEL